MQNKEQLSYADNTGVIPYNMTNDYMFRYILQENETVLRGLICALPEPLLPLKMKFFRLHLKYIQKTNTKIISNSLFPSSCT